jgi:hypothetical protein
MRTDLFSTLHSAALAGAAIVSLSGCHAPGVDDAVAGARDVRPAMRAAAVPVPPDAPAMSRAPRALHSPSTGAAALDAFREDADPSHAAIASYGD